MKQKQILVLSRQGYYSYVPVQGRTWRDIIGSQPIQSFYAICEIKESGEQRTKDATWHTIQCNNISLKNVCTYSCNNDVYL
jgi:hypothetical protein